jgi:exonuclease SbcD
LTEIADNPISMRILHTADWHLGDRLGRIDRTADLRKAVERVGDYCLQESVDLLLVAGDLFSELARPENLRETIEHWSHVFAPFLERNGTILTLTGNHDNENFCRTLNRAMSLAAPLIGGPGTTVNRGRLYLATEPTLLRLPDRDGGEVQFVLMPYPTPTRYLRDAAQQKYTSAEEKNRRLEEAFYRELRQLEQHPRFSKQLPAVLAAHINVRGSAVGTGLFRISEQEDVVLDAEQLAGEYAYVALGHVHKPQALGGQEQIRYSGSIEKMDLGESNDAKSVVLFEIGASGLQGPIRLLPLPSTPVYELFIHEPSVELDSLAEQYAEAHDDLVNLHLRYTAGKDHLEEILQRLETIFPRWYARDWKEANELDETLTIDDPAHGKGFRETVRDFVETELMNHPTEERDRILEQLDALLQESDP